MATINKNSIAFIGLANEYCQLLEQVAEIEKDEFVNELLRLLPRLYISISDMESIELESEIYIESYLEEVYYDSIRRNIETVIGEDDTFLEVFEEDMKYSDTPIAVSISEYLADIFQYLYDFILSIRDASEEHYNNCLFLCRENFEMYWGQTLCNVLRALHKIKVSNHL